MQVIYALPFVLLSIVSFLVCVAVPRWRRYSFQALVAPVAFGCRAVRMFVVRVEDQGRNQLRSVLWVEEH